jgi:hypothetical protein
MRNNGHLFKKMNTTEKLKKNVEILDGLLVFGCQQQQDQLKQSLILQRLPLSGSTSLLAV